MIEPVDDSPAAGVPPLPPDSLELTLDLGLTDKVAVVTGSSRGLGSRRRVRSWRRAAVSA